MWMVETDIEKNRVFIIIGEISEDDFIQFFIDVDEATQKIKPNFTLVADIRFLKIDSTPSLTTWHTKLEELLVLREVGRATRIIDDETKKIHVELDRISRSAGFRYIPTKTLQEAQNILDAWAEEQKQ